MEDDEVTHTIKEQWIMKIKTINYYFFYHIQYFVSSSEQFSLNMWLSWFIVV